MIGGQQKPLLLHTLANWFAVFDTLYLMLPADDPALHAVINDLPEEQLGRLRLVGVSDSDQGMSQSIKAGIDASRDAAGWLIGLADMPWVSPVVLADLKQAMIGGAGIAAPYYQDQRGQPVAFNAGYLPDLLALEGDQGARQLLLDNKSLIHAITSPDNGILRDIDKPADLPSVRPAVPSRY